MSSTHWKIHAAWSKAGVGTNIVLELRSSTTSLAGSNATKKMPRIAFDMGSTPVFDEAIPANYVFLSHGHVDHVGAVFSHARAHSVSCGG
jgi:L-ascorbate metabolism protein UlaG (beta-lactamase superfamily)